MPTLIFCPPPLWKILYPRLSLAVLGSEFCQTRTRRVMDVNLSSSTLKGKSRKCLQIGSQIFCCKISRIFSIEIVSTSAVLWRKKMISWYKLRLYPLNIENFRTTWSFILKNTLIFFLVFFSMGSKENILDTPPDSDWHWQKITVNLSVTGGGDYYSPLTYLHFWQKNIQKVSINILFIDN